MKIKSLGQRSNLITSRHDGVLKDRDNYLVVRNDEKPHFFWGNYIIMQSPPTESDYNRWTDIYKLEFGDRGPINYMTFAWDSPAGEEGTIDQFVKNGFVADRNIILSATKVNVPLKFNSNIIVKTLESEKDWNDSIEVHINDEWKFSKDSQEGFQKGQMLRKKKLKELGVGKCYGAFLDNKMVGCLSVFMDDNLASMDLVSTHQNFRRQGICGTLVYTASKLILEQTKVETLVIIADEDYHAAKIYESVGFKPTEKEVTLQWYDKKFYG